MNKDLFIKHIQDCMFNNATICKFMNSEQTSASAPQCNNFPQSNNFSQSNTFFTSFDNDSLFWCLYVMNNGIVNYTSLYNKNLLVEKKLKIEYIEKLRKNKEIIKKYKFASLISIEDSLVNDNVINISTFLSLCVLDNINIFYVNKKTYYELNPDNTTNTNKVYLIKYIDDKKKYSFKEYKKDDLDEYRKNYYKIDNFAKPINAESYYKICDLLEICKKLDIETTYKEKEKIKQITKKGLYNLIINYL